MADEIRSMPAQLRRVYGGYELFIPDEFASETGVSEGGPLTLDVVAHMLWVRDQSFIERVRATEPIYSGPPQLRDPHEPYDPPQGYPRAG